MDEATNSVRTFPNEEVNVKQTEAEAEDFAPSDVDKSAEDSIKQKDKGEEDDKVETADQNRNPSQVYEEVSANDTAIETTCEDPSVGEERETG